jgi:hypothetical protein
MTPIAANTESNPSLRRIISLVLRPARHSVTVPGAPASPR